MAPSSNHANNSPQSNDANRNKRRRNKSKRQKKQQQQQQKQHNPQQKQSQQTTNVQENHNNDFRKSEHDDVNENITASLVNDDHNQHEDCSLVDEVSNSIEESSNLQTPNTDDSPTSADTNDHSINVDTNNEIDDCSHADDNVNVIDINDESTDKALQNKNQCPMNDQPKTSSSLDHSEDNESVLTTNNNKNTIESNDNLCAKVQETHADVDKVILETPKSSINPYAEDENARREKLIRAKLKEYKKLRARFESQSTQMADLTEHVRKQANKITDLECLVLNSKKTCNNLEKLLQQEVACRTKLEQEKTTLCQTVNRLKTQIGIYEKNKLTNDELMRTINATLMERDTEVSMLKLKLTRLRTNQSSTMSTNGCLSDIDEINTKNDNITKDNHNPHDAFISAGRSNSEFNRNSALRSTMIADGGRGGATRSSTSQLRSVDDDSSVWASIPADLTPSRRPQLLEKSFQSIYNESKHNQQFNGISNNHTSTPLARDKRYKTLPPRSIIKSSERNNNRDKISTPSENMNMESIITDANLPTKSSSTANNKAMQSSNNTKCQVTNLDDSSTSGDRTSSTTNSSDNHANNVTLVSHDISVGFANKNDKSDATKQQKQQQLCNTMGLPVPSSALAPPTTETLNLVLASNKTSDPLNPSTSHNDKNAKIIDPSSIASTQMVMPPLTPSKKSSGLRKIFNRFRRSDSTASKTSDIYTDDDEILAPETPSKSKNSSIISPFKRNANRATLVGLPGDGRAQMSPKQQKMSFQTDKPFAEWNTDMIVEWLTMIGLSMYANQCRRWVKCGAHIMNATPAEVDKGLGITNHLHRKKLRLAISELNGDCDKVTKAAAKLDYLWIARWLDDLGLPQYKEAFINARIDGRVLNYLTVEDLVSMGVKSVLHHCSIKCGIRVLRSTNFDLQLLKRRATSDEIDEMNRIRQQVNHVNETLSQATPISLKQAVLSAHNNNNDNNGQLTNTNNNRSSNTELTLWTCHRVMEWLRLIDFAEFAPNLRGSGVHGGLLVYEDGFNFDTMCCLLSIPLSRTLLRRHLSTYFDQLIGKDLVVKKLQYRESSHLNPFDEIKTPKKTTLWPLTKLKSSSKVGQNGTDDYLVPMYPMEPQIIKATTANSQTNQQTSSTPTSQSQQQPQIHQLNKNDLNIHPSTLAQIPESVNV